MTRRISLKSPEGRPWICTHRVALAFLGFIGFANMYALKVNISVAIVCMVNGTEAENSTADNTGALTAEEQCKSDSKSSSTDGEFRWDNNIQGYILGAFFWGYIITQVPGGYLATHFGGKRVFGWFMFVCAIATVLTPVGARLHWGVLAALRFFAGLGQGVVWPSMHSIWSSWAPPKERSTLIGFTFAGSQVGNLVAFPLSAILCEYGFDGGWPSIFYIMGGFGIIWFILWMLFVSDTPGKHPRISPEEREYIEASLQGQVHTGSQIEVRIPWSAIFTSLPVWGIIVTHTCANWMTYLFLTKMPTYMKEVLGFDIKSNGLLSAVPYLGMWITIVISSLVADHVISKGLMTVTTVRKLSVTIGELFPALIVILLGFFDCTQSTVAVAVLTLGISLSGCPYGAGYMVNHADVAPRFSSILFGLSNTAASIPGFVVPIVAGALTKGKTREEWQSVFYITAAVVLFGWIFYVLTGSGELQPWATEGMRKPPEEIEEPYSDQEPEEMDKAPLPAEEAKEQEDQGATEAMPEEVQSLKQEPQAAGNKAEETMGEAGDTTEEEREDEAGGDEM